MSSPLKSPTSGAHSERPVLSSGTIGGPDGANLPILSIEDALGLIAAISDPVFYVRQETLYSANSAAEEWLAVPPAVRRLRIAAALNALSNANPESLDEGAELFEFKALHLSMVQAVLIKTVRREHWNPVLRTEFREIIDRVGLSYTIYDKDMRISYASPAANKFIDSGITLGKPLNEAFHISPESLEFYRSALVNRKILTVTDHRTSDNRLPKSLRVTVIPIGDELVVFYESNDPSEEQIAAIDKSNERFRKLSDSLSVALIILDADLNISYWNKMAEELSGLPKQKVLGHMAQEVFPLIRPEHAEEFAKVLQTKTSWQLPRLRYKDDRIDGYFDVKAFAVDEEIAVLIEDRTEQVRSQEKLEASEERFRTVSESMSLAFVMVDSDRKITYWNRMSEVTSGGVRAEEVLGIDILDGLPITEATLKMLFDGVRASAGGILLRVPPERPGVTGTYDIRAFAVGDEIGLMVEDVTLQVAQDAELDRSNHQLLDLYDNAPCGYLSVRADGSIDRINDRMVRWLVRTKQVVPDSEMADDRLVISEILTAQSFEVVSDLMRVTSIDEPFSNIELEFQKEDGMQFWGLVNAIPIFDQLTQTQYWRWTVVDITELRDAQRQIEDNRLFSQLFNELGEGVLISDKTGLIVRANKSAIRILGIPEDQLTKLYHDSSDWQAVLEDGTPVPVQDLPGVRALREKQPVSNLELGIVRPDGRLTWILESAAPLLDDNGDVTGVIVTFPEVAATVVQRQTLKDLNDKYQIERDRANDANRLKSSFLANMSHEIRTPMTAILGFSDILAGELSGKVSEQHYTFLRSINVSGKRLLNLINDILDLTKIEAGRLDLHSEELDVINEIECSVTPLAWIARQKGLSINVFPHNEKLVIRGDRQRFSQVLTNIISNAIKFTRSGSITVRTSLTEPSGNAIAGASSGPASQTKNVRIEIEDTGIGINKDFLPYLFEEFRQEHTGVTKEFGGTGLGLAISRRLVSLMGGTVHVRSVQGSGTTFILHFPLESRSALKVRPSSASIIAPLPPALPLTDNPVSDGSRRHVLVVEDNPETQRLLEVYLKNHYRVSQAMNASEAFDIVNSDTPDVILMDVNLPGKDGLSITREIRNGAVCPDIPIIALTAFAMTGDRQRCLDAGCNDYLSKPATKREVLEVIIKNLER